MSSGGDPDDPSAAPAPIRKVPVWLGIALLLFLAGIGIFLSAQGLRPDLPPIMSVVVFLSPMVFAPVVIAGMMGKDPMKVLGWIGGAVALAGLFAKGCSGS